MSTLRLLLSLIICIAMGGCGGDETSLVALDGVERGSYAVASTNMEVASEYEQIGDDAMHDALLGRFGQPDERLFIVDMLKHPESAWITNVHVPEQPSLYGPASGQILPVVTYLVYPAAPEAQKNAYAFPYHDAMYGEFEDMLEPGESPRFADPGERYPLIVLAHGAQAHGMYDVRHAQDLASNGFVVAVITYGEERYGDRDPKYQYVPFLRPLLTKSVLDSILESDAFGAHIDPQNIGISGHSFGGFTALAVAGGAVYGNAMSVVDKRFKAAAIAAPWVGGIYNGVEIFAFGANNSDLDRVDIPVISFFGTRDEATRAAYILPAMRHLAGPTYVVELVDQPHVFEGPSWVDRNKWELLFYNAFLKHDTASLQMLNTGGSMKGGNEDVQLFDYQRPAGSSLQ